MLYALHVPRPWYTPAAGYQATLAEHHRIVQALAARIAAERLPVVVVGDLNMPDRGRDYRHAAATATWSTPCATARPRYSSVGKWTPLLLRIDHVLVAGGWCGDAATASSSCPARTTAGSSRPSARAPDAAARRVGT